MNSWWDACAGHGGQATSAAVIRVNNNWVACAGYGGQATSAAGAEHAIGDTGILSPAALCGVRPANHHIRPQAQLHKLRAARLGPWETAGPLPAPRSPGLAAAGLPAPLRFWCAPRFPKLFAGSAKTAARCSCEDRDNVLMRRAKACKGKGRSTYSFI